MIQSFKDKFATWVSDRKDDIDFLRNSNISGLFKILNLLSGDRLRHSVLFANACVYDIKRHYDMIAEMKAEFDDITLEEYDGWIQHYLGWHIDRAVQECRDLWQL